MRRKHQNPLGAIVLGGNFVGLGIVRSLGAHGIPVWVFDVDRAKSIAQFSRHTARFVETRGEDIVQALLREGHDHGLNGWVLFPVTDEYVEALSIHREALSTIFRVTTATAEVTKFALDKRLTYQRAHELQIAAPWTATGNSLDAIEAEGVPYPVILKPAVNHHFFPQTNIKALPADNRAELQRGFAQMSQYIPAQEILIQERIPGGGENQFSYCGVCKDGHVYASLVAQRRRQYPVDFGNASTFVETTIQPEVEAAGRCFLESIRFDGVAEVEFKFDPRDGKYKILDVNPRTWGWHTLGKSVGLDFSYLLWCQSMGLPTTKAKSLRSAAWIREITDVVAIAKSRHRMAELKRLLSALVTGKLTVATFRFADPVPFFAEFALWISSGISRQKNAKKFLQLEPALVRPSGLTEHQGPAPERLASRIELGISPAPNLTTSGQSTTVRS